MVFFKEVYGKKDPQELRAFIGNVKNAVYTISRHIDRNLGQPEQEFTVDEFAVSEGVKEEGRPQEAPSPERLSSDAPAEKAQKQKGVRAKKQPER